MVWLSVTTAALSAPGNENRGLVAELIRRDRLPGDVRFSVPRSLYARYVRETLGPAVDPPVPLIREAGRYHLSISEAGRASLTAAIRYYCPAEGTYTVSGGFFSRAKTGFSGPMRVVEAFASLSTTPRAEVVRVAPAKQAARMQRAFDKKADVRARAAGATPIRVRLPINGELFRLEKILALPGDKLYFEVVYKGWQVAK